MFKLFPSEELIIETETNQVYKERKQSRYLLVIGIVLIFVAIFYRFASSQDWILSAVFYVSVLGVVMSLTAYAYKMYNALKTKGELKYYVTSRRIVETNKDGDVNRELLLTKVKRVEVKRSSGKAGDVIINPKDLSPQADYKQRLKGVSEKQYGKDTFVIKSIADAKHFAKIISE